LAAGPAGLAKLNAMVDFKDFAVLVAQWLDEQLWPALRLAAQCRSYG